MAFELAAFEGPRSATCAGYETRCCPVDCATTRGRRYKTCFLGGKNHSVYSFFFLNPKYVLSVPSLFVQKANRARKIL